MTNRLAETNSPYLLQHAENPVDWYPWGLEALEKARREDKPIFLSIGYAACHWCHVMAHESFEDPQTAQIMNESFINIKVDREERPDLDSIYMDAVVALTGQGGWPLSAFLTPDGKPFYGGTYFPPVRRYNLPSFRDLLASIAHTWKNDRQRLYEASEELYQHIRQGAVFSGAEQTLDKQQLTDAAMRLAQAYDWDHGGWGPAPKFPQPMVIEFLLRRAAKGDQMALDLALHTLQAMAGGGLYDVVAGGFARYSTDSEWLVPHFEKMLYDNAQLALAYLHAYLLTGITELRRVCEETLNFLVREMLHDRAPETVSQGGFFSSLDADSEGVEGKFYVWTLQEIRQALPKPEDADFLIAAYELTPAGNFEGANILQRRLTDEELAERFAIPLDEIPKKLDALHGKLLQAREQRVRPGTDDKVLVSWNALALRAFAEAARYLHREDYLAIARQNADFLLTELNPNDRLLRSWRNGVAHHNAYLEDYASLALGLIALYQTDPDPYWHRSAVGLVEEMLAHFRDPEWGFFDTRDDHDQLLTRPKEIQDHATPSGNSLAALALLQLSALTGNGAWRDVAECMLGRLQGPASHYPTAFSNWLCAIDFAVTPTTEIAILGDPELPQTQALLNAVWSAYRPNAVLAISPFPPPQGVPELLHERPLIDDQPTAYVCHSFICRQPVTQPEELLAQLAAQEA